MKKMFDGIDSSDIVVIASHGIGTYLEVIAKKNIQFKMDELKLQCVWKYQPKTEMIIRLLTGAYGWKETDRNRVNTKSRTGMDIDVLQIDIEKLGAIR